MAKAHKARITVELQLVSPLHITAIESGRYYPDSERVVVGATDGGWPCTLTRKMTVVRRDPVVNENGTFRLASVPVIPSATLCGKLRNAASRLIEDGFVARNETERPEAFLTMRSGAATATFKRDQQGVKLAIAGANDPFFGLFGGTTFGISSNLITHEGYAYTVESAPFLPFAFSAGASQPTAYETLGVVPIIRKNQLHAWDEIEHIRSLVTDEALIAYHSDQLTMTAASKAKKAAGESGKKEDLRTVASVEIVRPGTWFGLTFDVTYRNDEQLGLFLLALRSVVSEGQVGGGKAKGRGQFVVASCKVSTTEEGALNAADVFLPRLENGATEINTHDAIVGRVVASAESWLENITAAHYATLTADDANIRVELKAA